MSKDAPDFDEMIRRVKECRKNSVHAISVLIPDTDHLKLENLFAKSGLVGTQEGLDQFALAAHRHLGNRLNHFPPGTSGSVSIQSNRNSNCSEEIFRS